MLTPGLPSLAHGASSRFGSGPVASSSSTSSFTAAGIHATATTPLSQPIDARHPLVQNCRECEAFSEDLLRLGTPSPGDSKMWVLYGELPALCRKVFGSRGTGPGQLEIAGSNAAAHLVDLLQPSGPLAQAIFKSSAERIFYEINVDMLPRGIQRRLLAGDLEALPKFLRERVHYVTESAGEGQRAVDTPTTSMPTPFAEGQPTALTTHTRRPVVKFNMAEYYLFYLLYYPLWDFNAAPSASGSGVAANRPEALATPLKKATSLLSHTSEGIGGAAPIATPLPARTPVNYKRKPIFNTAYHAMLERYLSYLLPTADKVTTATSRSHQSHHRPNETTPLRLRKHQPPHSGATSRAGDALLASAGGDTIISSRYLDRNAQVRLSTFFIGLLSELWLHQNEYYVNAATMEPTLSGGAYEAPSADILRMVGVVERHVLAMDMEAMSEGMLRGSAVPVSGMDELSLYNPADVVRREAYLAFRAPFYRTLRLLFDFDVADIPVRLIFELWSTWLQPWKSCRGQVNVQALSLNDPWRFYVADNLHFYTTLLNSFLQLISVRAPVNSILVGLSRASPVDAAPVLGTGAMEDLDELRVVLEGVYHGVVGLHPWIQNCELALVPGASHYATSSSFYANATPQSPMFASGNGGAIDEDVLRYQPLLKQNYHILELAGYTPSTNQQNIATSVSSPLTGRAPTFLFDSRPGLPMTTSLQNLPASTYQPVVVDNEPVMVKKVIKKLLILSLAQEAWLRRNTKAVRNGSPKRHDIAAADQSSWLSMIFPSGAESQEQAVAELAKRIGAQREIITLCIQLVEMVFEHLPVEEKQMLRRQAQQQVTESFPNLEPSGRNGNAARKGHTRNAQQEHYERMLNTPETVPGNPLRLTERGREQLRTGARKCTNRDVAPVNDPANTEHIRSYEVALLVRPLVAAGQFLNRYWSPLILDTVERKTNSLFTFPGPWHSFRWERATRALAAKNNLLFLMVCWLVASAICWLIGL